MTCVKPEQCQAIAVLWADPPKNVPTFHLLRVPQEDSETRDGRVFVRRYTRRVWLRTWCMMLRHNVIACRRDTHEGVRDPNLRAARSGPRTGDNIDDSGSSGTPHVVTLGTVATPVVVRGPHAAGPVESSPTKPDSESPGMPQVAALDTVDTPVAEGVPHAAGSGQSSPRKPDSESCGTPPVATPGTAATHSRFGGEQPYGTERLWGGGAQEREGLEGIKNGSNGLGAERHP